MNKTERFTGVLQISIGIGTVLYCAGMGQHPYLFAVGIFMLLDARLWSIEVALRTQVPPILKVDRFAEEIQSDKAQGRYKLPREWQV